MSDGRPIAVLDSGVGGISVLRELLRVMPHEDYLFLGDTKNAPYGTKTTDEVRRITFANVEWLLAQGAKAIVVACNTATGAAVRALRETYPDLPVVGIEPAIKPAAAVGEHPRVLVCATPLTLRQEKFSRLCARFADRADIVPLPCPGLMEIVESGCTNGEPLSGYLSALFAPFAGQQIDAAVLGCTHYPLVRGAIAAALEQAVGHSVPLFDGGEGTAREAARRIEAAGLSGGGSGHVTFINTEPEQGSALFEKLLYQE